MKSGRKIKYHTDAERAAAKKASYTRYHRSPKGVASRARFAAARPREYFRNVALKHSRGITLEQKVAMRMAQGGGCAACGTDDPGHKHGWVVDHDHATGRNRGVLCQACNLIGGHMDKNPERVSRLTSYLGIPGIQAGNAAAALSLPG
jgi:hypothetical protein